MSNGNMRSTELSAVGGGERLRTDAARAYRALNRFCEHYHGSSIQHAGQGSCYRELGRPGDYHRGGRFTQWYAWERYNSGGNLAARPGYSNHGLGAACDFETIELARKYGSRFGWRKTEAFGEPWHYCYVKGRYPLVALWSEVRGGDTIRPGDHGSGVRVAKRLLKRHGYWRWPRASSSYSRAFGAAIKRFQRARGLPSDGIIGKRTWDALKRPGKGSR